MVPLLWTPGMTNVLLRHVESQKGEKSIYLNNRNLALEEAKALLASSYPQQSISTTQIRSRLERLWYRKRRCSSHFFVNLFLEGRSLLGEDFAEEALDQAQRDQDGKDSSGHCQAPAGLRTPSKSKNSDQGKGASRTALNRALQRGKRKTRRGSSFTSLTVSRVSESRSPPSVSNQEAVPRYLRPSGVGQDRLDGKPLLPTEKTPRVLITPADTVRANVSQSHGLIDHRPSPLSRRSFAGTRTNESVREEGFGQVFATDQNSELQGLAVLQRYLDEDHNKYIPTAKTLEEYKIEIVDQIRGTMQDLLESAETHRDTDSRSYAAAMYERVPDLYVASGSKAFFDICKRVYAAGNIQDLHEKTLTSFVSMQDLLCTLLAAAVDEWVLNGCHPDLPNLSDKPGISMAFENQIALAHPQLYELALRKSRSLHVTDVENLKRFAPNLSLRLAQTFKPFLVSNNIRQSGEGVSQLLKNLDAVFLTALQLRGQLSLKDGAYTVWPRANSKFNPKTMTAVEPVGTSSEWRVQMARFPALIQRVELDGKQDMFEERTIFTASVLLQ